MMKKIISILLILLSLCLCLSGCKKENENEDELESAKDIIIFDATGRSCGLSDLKGNAVVLNFFTSWCPPCKAELPAFEKAYKNYGDQVIFLMVNLVGWEDSPTDGKKFIEDSGYTFPVYYDLDGTADIKYDIESIPQTFFINKDGKIADHHSGLITYAGLVSGINKIK